eukprot:4043509-Amphidinium_carterae.1
MVKVIVPSRSVTNGPKGEPSTAIMDEDSFPYQASNTATPCRKQTNLPKILLGADGFGVGY